MAATVSTRWFWSDWMSDPGLRACSYAARGLWKDLLCIAGSNKKEYGFVSLNGRKLTVAELARMTNGSEVEVFLLLQELELNGVFSVDRREIIYCRRMVRAEKNRSNGRLGGNPKLLKKNDNQKSVEPRPKALIPEPEPEPKQDSLFPNGNSAPIGKPKKPPTPLEIERKDFFDRGKAVLGDGAGGLLNQILAVKHGNVALARAAIEQASTMDNPRQYVGGIVRGGTNGKAPITGGSKNGFADLAARIRFGRGAETAAGSFAENQQPSNGHRHPQVGLEFVERSGERSQDPPRTNRG